MPYVPNEPTTVSVPVPQEKTLDTYHVHGVNILVDPNSDEVAIEVRWSEGYDDAGTYVVAKWHDDTFGGPELSGPVGQLRGPIREAVWGLIVATGKVPPGSVTE